MNDEDVKFYLVNESDSKSIVSDIVTYGLLLGCFWLNYEFTGNSTILQLTLAFVFIVSVFGRASKHVRRMKPREMRDYLNAKFPPEAA